jgi:uncharacterized phiE125 gp8 family phage protein
LTPKVITPVVAPVIPLSELREHLRLDLLGGVTHPDDALILGYLSAARSYCEHYTQLSIGQQTLEIGLDFFPENEIELPLGAESIESVKYTDSSLVSHTLSVTEYALDNYSHQNWLLTSSTWPVAGEYANAVKVRYLTPSTIDPAVKSAMLLFVGHLYENREQVTTSQMFHAPMGVTSLLDTQRVWSL